MPQNLQQHDRGIEIASCTSAPKTAGGATASLAGVYPLPSVGIDALEPTDVLLIDKREQRTAVRRCAGCRAACSGFSRKTLAALQQRLVLSLQNTAEARYQEFTRLYPHLEGRIPDYHVASYLESVPSFSASSATGRKSVDRHSESRNASKLDLLRRQSARRTTFARVRPACRAGVSRLLGERQPVVHQPVARAKSPIAARCVSGWRSTRTPRSAAREFRRRCRCRAAESRFTMNQLVAQAPRGTSYLSAVDGCIQGSGPDGRDMAGRASDLP